MGSLNHITIFVLCQLQTIWCFRGIKIRNWNALWALPCWAEAWSEFLLTPHFTASVEVPIIMIPFLYFSLPMQGGNALSDCNIALRDEEEESLLGEPIYKEKRKWCIQNTNMTRHESSVSKWKYFWFWQKYKTHYFMGFFSGIGIYGKEKYVVFQRTQIFKCVKKCVKKYSHPKDAVQKMFSEFNLKMFITWVRAISST